jgi:hypothetical protein
MAKIRSAIHLQAALDSEIGWRVSELSNFKAAVSASSSLRKTVLLRASIPIAYSHWEGFVKNSASQFGSYLSGAGLFYKDVKPCFSGLAVMSLVQRIEGIKRKIATASALVSDIQSYGDRPLVINLWPVVEDIGNLNFNAFEEIAQFLDINTLPYEARKNFIDESLIAARNKIAHGERLEVDEEGFKTVFREVNNLMRSFKTDIENSVSSKSYLREPNPVVA